MKIESVYKNITIKQANIFTIIIVFIFSIIFVALLIGEMYNDYEKTLKSSSYLKQIDISSEKQKEDTTEKLKSLLIKTVLAVITLSFILFALSLGIYKVFHSFLQRDIQVFLEFFKDTASKKNIINPDMIFFKDFEAMANHANEMVLTIDNQQKVLQELNQELENKVQIKTADLEEINKNLLQEKIFSQDLLKAQKEFLRYAVHETNTPLSVILTSIELFVLKNKKDRQLSKIEAAVKNIFNIYDDLSYLVKKEQIKYPKNAIDIVAFLNARVDFFEEVAQLSKINFKNIQQDESLYIYFNETKLQRIIDNNITNAIKYTLPNEVVEIMIKKDGPFLDFIIGSKSKKIEDTDKIFDAYYREEKKREGFGIGLRLVKSICDEEGVKISLDSSGKQTVFSYRFKMMGE